MGRKTQIHAVDGKQELLITRKFDLPRALLFKAYVEPDLFEEWMGTKVLKLECKRHGSYQFETTDPHGKKHRFNGVIHEFIPNRKITRTFEMEDTDFAVHLEFLEFEKLTEETSKLKTHIVFKSVAYRDQLMQLPFAQGANMAHNRLQKIMSRLHDDVSD